MTYTQAKQYLKDNNIILLCDEKDADKVWAEFWTNNKEEMLKIGMPEFPRQYYQENK